MNPFWQLTASFMSALSLKPKGLCILCPTPDDKYRGNLVEKTFPRNTIWPVQVCPVHAGMFDPVRPCPGPTASFIQLMSLNPKDPCVACPKVWVVPHQQACGQHLLELAALIVRRTPACGEGQSCLRVLQAAREA